MRAIDRSFAGAVAVVVSGLLAACGTGGDGPAMGGDGEAKVTERGGGGGSRDAILAAWKKGGLSPSALTPATTSVGKDCQSGTVGAVDVLMCSFPAAADAKAAESVALSWIGDATGATHVSGSVLIVIADRRKSDPSGRTINQLMKLAPN